MAKKKSPDSPGKSPLGTLSSDVFSTGPAGAAATPIWLLSSADDVGKLAPHHQRWLAAQGFKPTQRKPVLLPSAEGDLAAVAFGTEVRANGRPADPMSRAELATGLIAPLLPAGDYRLASGVSDKGLAAVAWGLGAYAFKRLKSGEQGLVARLALPDDAEYRRATAIVDAVGFGRDLVNTPANMMGPAEIEAAAVALASLHGASIESIVGDELLAKNFPLIHAVGRASSRAPRLIDMRWQPPGAIKALPKVTLVGKGIAFDTGGLDLKPSAGMLLMKKDMGGAAAVLAIAHMVMATKLPVRLRVLISAAENSVSGNAFRPMDVITSRAGLTVEIGNTDAEGRLVLADALALADEEKPDVLVTMATLTGAARVAMGAEVAPFFTDDDALADDLASAGTRVADPVWRLPFWSSYEAGLESPVADLNNVSEGPFGGAITAALFLRKFVKHAARYAHFDIYGWRPAAKALGPKGGEVNAARAIFDALSRSYPS